MTDTSQNWEKLYKRLLERHKATFEKTKLRVIETETANMELEQIFNQSSAGIWVIDTNFEILRINETLAALSGAKTDDVRGRKCYDVFPISLCGTHHCPMHRIGEGRLNIEYDIEKETRGGKDASYLLTVNPFFGLTGKIMGLVGEFKDITPRRRAERALREANKALQRLSDIDALTQVANRRRFDEVLKSEWKRTNRSLSPLSLIFCDIDYFKLYNDTYGHQAGDECLKRVARTINSYLNRPEDFLARYGGEEFLLVLPNTEGRGAFHLAETIRKGLEGEKIPHKKSLISPYVTLSLGVAAIIPHESPQTDLWGSMPAALIEIADQALYEGKRNGRNQTVLKTVPGIENDVFKEKTRDAVNQA